MKWPYYTQRNTMHVPVWFRLYCFSACLPACACIEHGEKERSWKRESKVVNLLFTISRLDSNLFLLYQKKRKKKRRKIWRLLAHSFIFLLFPNRRDAWVSGSRSSRQLTSCSPSGQDDAIGGGGGGSGGLCRVSRRLTDRLFFFT